MLRRLNAPRLLTSRPPARRSLRVMAMPSTTDRRQRPASDTAIKHDSLRTYDLAIYGATGFTGRLVAAHVADKLKDGQKLSVALVGRSPSKLTALKTALTLHNPSAAVMTVVHADSTDQGSVDAVVKDCKVLLAVAGPFGSYGHPVVDACVRLGTDYVDITGEPDYVRSLIDKYDDAAKAMGVRVVPCCGYDSVPFDIGCFVAAEKLRHSTGMPAAAVEALIGHSAGGVSGGTIASAARCIDEVPMTAMADPYMFVPEAAEGVSRSGKSPQGMLRWSPECHSWTAPSIMAGINSKVVYRSMHLLQARGTYDAGAKYNECMLMPGVITAALALGGMTALGVGLYFSLTRWLLTATVLPSPGQGPSEEARKGGFFTVHTLARGCEDSEGKVAETVGLFQYQKGDPGYQATSLMVLEAALSLLQTRNDADAVVGVHTPASAMGWTMVQNLRASGFLVGAETLPPKCHAHTLQLSPDALQWVPTS